MIGRMIAPAAQMISPSPGREVQKTISFDRKCSGVLDSRIPNHSDTRPLPIDANGLLLQKIISLDEDKMSRAIPWAYSGAFGTASLEIQGKAQSSSAPRVLFK
jgi:hypothetical protein